MIWVNDGCRNVRPKISFIGRKERNSGPRCVYQLLKNYSHIWRQMLLDSLESVGNTYDSKIVCELRFSRCLSPAKQKVNGSPRLGNVTVRV